MARNEGTTAIHRAGLADYVTHLIKIGWSEWEIRRHLKDSEGLDLTRMQMRYFYRNYCEAPDPETEKRIAAVREASIRDYDVVYERQRFARILGVTIEILGDQIIEMGPDAWKDEKMARLIRILGEVFNKTLDAVKRDLFDTKRLEKATSEILAEQVNLRFQSIQMVQAIMEKGISESDAIDAIHVGVFGKERLGRAGASDVCAEALGDQERPILIGGPPVSEKDVHESDAR